MIPAAAPPTTAFTTAALLLPATAAITMVAQLACAAGFLPVAAAAATKAAPELNVVLRPPPGEPLLGADDDPGMVGDAVIGTPPQRFSVYYSTQSMNSWLVSPACTGCLGGKRFDKNSSLTSRSESDRPYPFLVNFQGIVSNSSSYYGVTAVDVVDFGSRVNDTIYPFTVLVNSTKTLNLSRADGVFSLGLPPTIPLNKTEPLTPLLAHATGVSKAFVLNVADDLSNATLTGLNGGYNPYYVPVMEDGAATGLWALSLDTIAVGTDVFDMKAYFKESAPFSALTPYLTVDTESVFGTVPSQVLGILHRHIAGSTLYDDFSALSVPCSARANNTPEATLYAF
ncbi:aspartic peptidase domain-containing protein [Zopfochytrium polystomum]|nr:aspartic peptidase domain-containing protein [Zopfochytrium polystomum]